MKRKWQLIIGSALALVVTSGLYAFSYLTATATTDITVAGTEIATYEPSATQPNWDSILTPTGDTETLRPNATGTYSQCDPNGDSPNYACVDDVTADEDSTYVSTWFGATELDTYNIANHSEGTGTISSVTVYIRSRVTSDTHAIEVALRTNGADYFGTYTPISSTSYTNISATWTENPYTTDDWTWAEVDALEAGVRHYDLGTGYLMTTQVYVEVDYAYIPLSGDVPTGDLFDITPHTDFSGDLAVKVYLVNSGDLIKAYQSLNMNLYLEGSVEAGETPNYRTLTLENGWVIFNLKDYSPDTYTLSVSGGDYELVSRDTSEWEEGWTVTPELYCQIVQRGE